MQTYYSTEMMDLADAFPLAISMWEGMSVTDDAAWAINAHDWEQLLLQWMRTQDPNYLIFWGLAEFLAFFFHTTRHGKMRLRPKFRKA